VLHIPDVLLMLFCIRMLKLKIFTYYTVFENCIRCLDQQRKNLVKEILDFILRVFRQKYNIDF